MRTTIQIESDLDEKKIDLTFSDEAYEAGGYLDMIIGEVGYTVHLDDLMPALIAFDAKRGRQVEWDKEYE